MSDLKEIRELLEWFGANVLKIENRESTPPTREGLLEWARSTKELPPWDRQERVLRIIEHSLEAGEPPCSVAEIFEENYDDTAGQEYWRAFLKFEPSEASVARRLSIHLAAERPNATVFAAEGNCVRALARYPSREIVDRLSAIAGDEDLSHLIPPSLHAFLVSKLPSQTKAPLCHVSEKELRDFLNKTATPQHTKPELRVLADQAFPDRHITDSAFNSAYKNLPSNQKRAPGDTDKTLKKRQCSKG